MSQFGAPHGEAAFPHDPMQPAKTSGMAVTALICSLIFCCPLTTLLGVLLGVVALVSIGGNPARKGKGIALAAVIIGILGTIGSGYGMVKLYGFVKQSMAFVMTGPRDALAAGFSGDLDGMRAGFYGPGATVSDEQAQAFIDEARGRYGDFVTCRMDEQAQAPQPRFGQPTATLPYVFEFENATIRGEAEAVFADPQAGFIYKFGYVTLFDEEHGDLTFPSDAAPGAPVESSDDDAPGGDGGDGDGSG